MSAVRKPDSSSLLVPAPFALCHLGVRPYVETYEAMRAHLGPDEVWLLEHPPVYTLGQAGRINHLHCPTLMVGETLMADTVDGHIPVIQSDRGGQITYHGPGQVVVYLLVDVARRRLKVRALVGLMEEVIISTLEEFGVVGTRRPKAPGVYVREEKIAHLGLRIRRGRCYHGLSLNVNMNLAPFGLIDPCGMEGLKVTQLSHFYPGIATSQVFAVLASHLSAHLFAPVGPQIPNEFSNDSATSEFHHDPVST